MPEEASTAQSSAEEIITAENLSSEKSRARALAFEYTARLDTLSSNVFEGGLTRLNQMFFLPWNSPEEELISRICSLAFHLQVSGGLLTAQPRKVLGNTVIDLEAAMNGFLRRESSGEAAKRKSKKIIAHGGSRQFLYIEGRVQTLSFIHYRLKDDSSFKGEVGGELLPPLTPAIVKAALPNYPWLKTLKMNSPTWNGVYRAWLHNLFNLTDKTPNILLSDVSELAARRLYQTESPFICYLRRQRIRQAFLPDAPALFLRRRE